MTPRVLILGGGVAGLTTALALARGGVPVDVLERDVAPAPFGRRSAALWVRDGAPQAQHAHVFGPGCHRMLTAELPDVLSLLLRAGAREFTPSGPAPITGTALALRRPLFDWVLRRAAEREPGVRVHCGTPATGLRTDGSRLTGVVVRGGVLAADVVVDATGRRGQLPGWLAGLGYPRAHPRPASTPAPTTYYSRGYALRWSGDPGVLNLGLAAGGDFDGYTCRAVPGDNNTVTVTFGLPAADPGSNGGAGKLAALRMPDCFQAAAERVPAVADWVEPGAADPLGGVAVLADRTPDRAPDPAPGAGGDGALPGLVAVGDARAVPAVAAGHGVSVALAQALACAAAILDGVADDLEAPVRAAQLDGLSLPTPPRGSPSGPSACELARIAESAGATTRVSA